MSSAVLQHLVILSRVTTFAAALVALVRVPLRGVMEARAAYWLWPSVPAHASAAACPLSRQRAQAQHPRQSRA